MNTFIERSNALFVARPDTTRVSTRFTHKKIDRQEDGGVLPAVAVVKTFDPVSGTLYKFRVKKINELNRILRSLGPYPVDSSENGAPVTKRGIASLMADVEYNETQAAAAAPSAAAGEAKKSKNKKKKNK